MTETRKLTRQERKEALAYWDQSIAMTERYSDGRDPAWREVDAAKVMILQQQRAAHLAKLEGRTTNEITP
jgi:hypothetical protein